MSASLPIRSRNPLTVRSPALRSMALSCEKAFFYRVEVQAVGREEAHGAPGASNLSFTTARLWLKRLPMMTMSPECSSGTRACATQASNQSPLTSPSSTIGASMPVIQPRLNLDQRHVARLGDQLMDISPIGPDLARMTVAATRPGHAPTPVVAR